MRKGLFFMISVVVVFVLAACGGANDTNKTTVNQGANNTADASGEDGESYVLKLVHSHPQASMHHQYVEWFDEEIQKRSNGRLKIEAYSDGQLMPSDQEIPAMLQGQVDMVHSSSAIAGSFDPIWYFFDLPFLFNYDPNDNDVYMDNKKAFMDSEDGGQKVAKMMEDKGIKVLSMSSTDMYGTVWTGKEGDLITDPKSAKGLKIRVPGGPVASEMLKTVGANGTSIPGPELPTALQQGVVDGMIIVPLYVYDNKLPIETQSLYPLISYVMPFMISMDTFESLPEDLQQILVETGKDLEVHADALVREKGADVFEKLESEQDVETYYPTQEEINEWMKATEVMYEKYAEEEPRATELIEEANRIKEEFKD
ncbi:TRAP transporter substrate-binding protein [Pseudogracilibacillus sp. SO10305]|uniref:TRAP transporter substrate-binding protein n=1 Tax=Pseudogracilibacillus sp. SO10305 TaxID=3098292 RepID=UPI00300E1BEF